MLKLVLSRCAWLAVFFEKDGTTSFIDTAKNRKLMKYFGSDEVYVKWGPKWFLGKILARGESQKECEDFLEAAGHNKSTEEGTEDDTSGDESLKENIPPETEEPHQPERPTAGVLLPSTNVMYVPLEVQEAITNMEEEARSPEYPPSTGFANTPAWPYSQLNSVQVDKNSNISSPKGSSTHEDRKEGQSTDGSPKEHPGAESPGIDQNTSRAASSRGTNSSGGSLVTEDAISALGGRDISVDSEVAKSAGKTS